MDAGVEWSLNDYALSSKRQLVFFNIFTCQGCNISRLLMSPTETVDQGLSGKGG